MCKVIVIIIIYTGTLYLTGSRQEYMCGVHPSLITCNYLSNSSYSTVHGYTADYLPIHSISNICMYAAA